MTEMKDNGGGETSLMVVGSKGIVISTMDDLWRFSGAVMEAGLAPKGANRPQIVLSIQHGLEIGLSPMQALQNIAVINGRSTIWGDSALALCKRHRDWGWIKESIEGEGDKRRATCTVKRKREPECVHEFSVEDAKLAKLWGKQGPWTQYPKRMLQMRARGFCLRDSFPDALRGLMMAEEAQDIEPIETEHRVLPNALELTAEDQAYSENQTELDEALAAAENLGELDKAIMDHAEAEPTDAQRSVYRQFEVGYQQAGKVEDVDQVDGGLTARIKSTLTVDQINALECMSEEKRETLSKTDGVML